MTEVSRSLHRKLAQVMFEVGRIPKNGRAPAAMGGFEFVQVGDAADVIRKALAEHNVSMLPTSIEPLAEAEHETARGGTMTTTTVRVTWTLTDADTGETAQIQSMGTGSDTGDKFTPKAQTNAMKYALLMGFLLSTGDDPELSDSTDRQRGRTAARAEGDPYGEPEPAAATGAESLELLGRITKPGVIRKGGAQFYKLEARETPDGHVIGFRLELPDDKDIPQVVAEGELGRALYLATGGDPETLLGVKATCKGRLYNVRYPGRRAYYRLVLTDISTPDFTIPTPEPPATAAPTIDAEVDAQLTAAGV